ncbi:hypothetical protein ABT187_48045 [Streptomyces sp. NPDC001817]|uniref:hypothetical protein n=1 Tax=Streptomyces sp. NPDC001817 TaxID=3154398 RepID=UPI0033257A1E
MEPDDVQHVRVLASILYNQAMIQAMNGAVADGILAARGAVEAYDSLIPGVGPEEAAASVALRSAGGFLHGPADGGVPVHETALEAADAKARLCGLLAEAHGEQALAEVRRLGEEAVAVYEAVARVLPGHEAGLHRVRSLCAVALEAAEPEEALQEVSHLRGLARFRVPAHWAVLAADGATTADAPGIGRVVRAGQDRRRGPGSARHPRCGPDNGCILRSTDSEAPLPNRPARRIRQWELVQPLADQVRVVTFTFDYDAVGGHAKALAVLEREVPAVVLGP